MVDSQHRYDQ
jgi:hypothetical protein